MTILLDDEPFTSSGIWDEPLETNEVKVVDDAVALIEVKAIIRQLRAACDKALQLRGIWVAINDPLALEGEKQILRERYQQIEAEIRAAERSAYEFGKNS